MFIFEDMDWSACLSFQCPTCSSLARTAVRFRPIGIMFGFLPSPLVRKRPLAAALKLGTPVNPSSKQAKSDYRVRGTSIPCSKRAISDCSVRGTSIPYSKKAISDYGVRSAEISQIRNSAERHLLPTEHSALRRK